MASLSCPGVNPPATSVAYFGPAATFSHEALLTQPDLAAAELRPLGTITAVLEAVAEGQVDLGFVPIENAIEGTVSATIDGLIFDVDLFIQREVVMDIHLHLMARPGTALGDLRQVSSYPHALAQCQKFLARRLPGAEQRAANSTADAARVLGESGATDAAAGLTGGRNMPGSGGTDGPVSLPVAHGNANGLVDGGCDIGASGEGASGLALLVAFLIAGRRKVTGNLRRR